MALSDNDTNKPKRVKTPNLEVEQQTNADKIAMDRAVNADLGVRRKARGLRFSKFVPPGPIGNIDPADETI